MRKQKENKRILNKYLLKSPFLFLFLFLHIIVDYMPINVKKAFSWPLIILLLPRLATIKRNP